MSEKRFRCIADFTFWAENIDDAFRQLAEHFSALAEGREPERIIEGGAIKIGPVSSSSCPSGEVLTD